MRKRGVVEKMTGPRERRLVDEVCRLRQEVDGMKTMVRAWAGMLATVIESELYDVNPRAFDALAQYQAELKQEGTVGPC